MGILKYMVLYCNLIREVFHPLNPDFFECLHAIRAAGESHPTPYASCNFGVRACAPRNRFVLFSIHDEKPMWQGAYAPLSVTIVLF